MNWKKIQHINVSFKNNLLQSFMMFMLISCNPDLGLLSELNYAQNEIFPITIDKYGIPNVKIELKKNPVWVQWDTGDMVGLVLSENIIRKCKLTVKDSIHLRDSEGKSAGYSYRYYADSVKIFNSTNKNMTVSTAIGDYNGLIGPRFVDLSRFTLDYKNKVIGISKSPLPGHKTNGEVLPMIKAERLPKLIIVEGSVNGKKVLIELDTGKSRTVIDTELVSAMSLPEGKYGVIIKKLKLGEIELKITNAKLKSFKGISKGLPTPIRVGIGADVLSQYIFTVDYDKGIVILNKN